MAAKRDCVSDAQQRVRAKLTFDGLNSSTWCRGLVISRTSDHRLFTITRKTPMMVVLDTQSGKEVARLRAAGECDDVFFDASRKRIYVIGGEGIISVFQQDDPDHYELVANVPSAVGIRTGYYFAKRDRFYVAVPAKGNEPAQVWTFEAED
jgi:hypothetical protein